MNRIAAAIIALALSAGAAFAQVGQGNGSPIGPGSGGSGGGGGGSGTVTSIATGCQATGGTITTTGTISTQVTPTDVTGANPPITTGYCGGLENLDNGSNQVPTIAVAGSAGFPIGWYTDLCNINAGTQTVTPASGTIGGASTYVLAAGTAAAPKCVRIISDGVSNYLIEFPPGAGGAPSGAAGGSLAGTYPNPTIASSVSLPGSPTTTTQAQADNSTKVATTAYADLAVANLLPVSGANGGTGVANTAKTITIGASVTTTGAGAPTLAFPATPQTYTFPSAADTLAGLLTFAAPPAIGNTTPAAGSFTTLSASSTVSGTGFSTYLASPPAIGGSAAAAGSFTTLNATTDFLTNGTTFPAQAAGQTVVTGVIAAPTLTTTGGQAVLYTTATGGAVLQGFGSSNDIVLSNKSGSAYMTGATGSQNTTFFGTMNNSGQYITGANTASITQSTFRNSSANAAAGQALSVGNNTSATEFNITVLSSAAGVPNQATVLSGGPLVMSTNGTPFMTASAAQLVALPAITSDATHTDSTVCQDSTTHAIYAGSGTIGICLGTSSARYKNTIVDLSDGLAQILALKPVNFFYNKDRGDYGEHEQYGFIAEDVIRVLPKLTALDAEGKPNSVDILGMVPILVKAMQEQQASIEALETRLAEIESPTRGAILKKDLQPYVPNQGTSIMPVSVH